MNILLKGVLCDDLSDEIPYLITFFSSKQDESAWWVYLEEGHPINHEILFGEFEIELFLWLVFGLACDEAKAKPASFCTFISDVVESEEWSVTSHDHSILEIIGDFSNLMNFYGLISSG